MEQNKTIKKSLHEWDKLYITDKETLSIINLNDEQEIVEKLSKSNIVMVQELKDKIFIQSFAYVGRIQIGNLEITIIPKINELPFIKLLDYTFDLNFMSTYTDTSQTLSKIGFIELLIYRLAMEIKGIINKGIYKTYEKIDEQLNLYRGSINFNELIHLTATKSSKLPCRYFNRIENNLLNQVLFAGSLYASAKSKNDIVKNEFRISNSYLKQIVNHMELNQPLIEEAFRQLNRLNNYYFGVLKMIYFLYNLSGISLEKEQRNININGFLINMNTFFQRLLTKFLKENVKEYEVVSEYQIKNYIRFHSNYNPKRSRNPTPRPDFALKQREKILLFMDAKYIDLWKRDIPSYIIYQIAIYALSMEGDINTAIVFYPAINNIPIDSVIEIGNPDNLKKKTTIIFRPVNMRRLCELLELKNLKGTQNFVKYLISKNFSNHLN